ncbi:VPLPA-CTERM sorting domain-containing protein [Roseovarius sp. S1116L3]|uniref:VPLPA-CTERM sorting domain-containing protein n=1 Tax=Roseovarius roseus TaxID=3342636 RepID=UPI003728FA99
MLIHDRRRRPRASFDAILSNLTIEMGELTMNIKKTLLSTTVAAGAVGIFLMGATSASAATLSIDGGTAGVIPGGSAVNDGLGPLGLANPLAGFYGSTINLSGPAKVTFTLLGYEAGFNNTFTYGSDELNGGGGVGGSTGTWSAAGLDSFMAIAGAGTLAFSFSTDGNGGSTAVNGSNPDNTGPEINFFASAAGDQSGKFVYLFLDDGGAGNDDNHDDLVVRVDVAPVPLPAAGILLFGALGGLAAMRRRKKAA